MRLASAMTCTLSRSETRRVSTRQRPMTTSISLRLVWAISFQMSCTGASPVLATTDPSKS